MKVQLLATLTGQQSMCKWNRLRVQRDAEEASDKGMTLQNKVTSTRHSFSLLIYSQGLDLVSFDF